MKEITTRIAQHLDMNAVPYRIVEHEAAGSADEYHRVLGTDYEQQAKALFVRFRKGSDRGFAVVAVQAQKKVDLARVRDLLRATKASLGTAEQLQEVTGCAFGELPPLGALFGLPLLLDHELLEQEEIFFNAGDLTVSIAADPTKLAESEKALSY